MGIFAGGDFTVYPPRDHGPAGRPVSLDDVARASGVSRASASRALSLTDEQCPLNADTRERIRAQASRLGYRPNLLAVSLSKRRSGLASGDLVAVEFDPARDDFSPGSPVGDRIRQVIARGQKPVLVAVEDPRITPGDQPATDHTGWKSDASWD